MIKYTPGSRQTFSDLGLRLYINIKGATGCIYTHIATPVHGLVYVSYSCTLDIDIICTQTFYLN